jgi:elongation factor 3
MGTTWRHPNVRIAYVAQHAFHHIEQHLDKTPNEYMQWRYCTGEDREAVQKESAKISAEEEKKMAEKVSLDGSKFTVEQVLTRRQLKNSYEYEVKFVGLANDKNKWLPRKWLEDNGFDKLVNAVDSREAAAMGLHSKPLTAANIAKHFAEVGLEQEYTLHSRMRGLSGGQKVKVVLAAAMWHNPHMLVLDEPTNNLDRDSLGALAAAIKAFGGGVILITHNAEFANHICSEVWLVDHGHLNVTGESWTKEEKIVAKKAEAEVTDAAGNVIKVVQAKKQLTRAEMKKVIKTRLAKIKKGEDVSDEEPWMAEFMGEA